MHSDREADLYAIRSLREEVTHARQAVDAIATGRYVLPYENEIRDLRQRLAYKEREFLDIIAAHERQLQKLSEDAVREAVAFNTALKQKEDTIRELREERVRLQEKHDEDRDRLREKYEAEPTYPPRRATAVAAELARLRRPVNLHMKSGSLGDALSRAVDVVRDVCRNQNVELVCDYSANLGLLFMDENLLVDAFLQILHNALDAMPEGGALTVACRRVVVSGTVEIVFTDTGPGMSRAQIEGAFDHSLSTRNRLGLGLFSARRIVEALGGKLLLSSEEGEGLSVTFILLMGSKQDRGKLQFL